MKDTILDQKAKAEYIRKPYTKPHIIRVNLAAKEAVLAGGCKTLNGPAAAGASGSCNMSPVPPANCRDFGS